MKNQAILIAMLLGVPVGGAAAGELMEVPPLPVVGAPVSATASALAAEAAGTGYNRPLGYTMGGKTVLDVVQEDGLVSSNPNRRLSDLERRLSTIVVNDPDKTKCVFVGQRSSNNGLTDWRQNIAVSTFVMNCQ